MNTELSIKTYQQSNNQQKILPAKNKKESTSSAVSELATKQILSYSDIAPFGTRHCKPDPKVPFTTQGSASTFVVRQTAILLNVPDRIVKNKAFEILANNEQTSGTKTCSIIDKSTWKDLDLICGSDELPELYLGNIINRSATELGKTYLLGLIARPIVDVQVLKKRQQLVKALAGPYHQLATALGTHLEHMPKGEKQLMSFWDEKLQLPGCINNQYFKYNKRINEIGNRSSVALEINSMLENTKKIAAAVTQVASTVLLPLYALSLTGAFNTPSCLEGYATRFIGTSGPLYAVASIIPNKLAQGVTSIAAGIFSALGLEGRIQWTIADLAIDSVIQNKLVSVASYYRNMKTIHGLLVKAPKLTKNFDHFAKLDAFINNKDLSNLFTTLESRTFNSEASFFFRRGNVLLAWDLLQDKKVKKEFESAMMAIAEIDSFISITQLYNENKEGHQRFPLKDFSSLKKSFSLRIQTLKIHITSGEHLVADF